MFALLLALACVTATPEERDTQDMAEQALSMLVSKKARWDEPSGTLEITGAGKFAEQDLRAVRHLRDVRTLYIAYTLGDDELAGLRELPQVEKLVLRGDRFTDKAVSHIAAMPSLKTLEMENCRLTATGVAELGSMKGLTSLSLLQVSLPDQAIASLGSVPSLEVLTLSRTSSVAGLSGCRDLRVLALRGVDANRLTADGLAAEVGELKQLEQLSMTVRELPILPRGLENWVAFDIQLGCFVAGRNYPHLARLKAALPETKIAIEFENRVFRFEGRKGSSTIEVK